MSGICSDNAGPLVLIVEDDVRLAKLTATYLEQHGFATVCSYRSTGAAELIAAHDPDIVILDLMLPDGDGIELCRQIRVFFGGPILMLTARDASIDQIVGLEAGADDYVTKPADPMVLVARVRALLRRGHAPAPATGDVALGQLVIREAAREVELAGTRVELTSAEYALLSMLARHAGEVLSRDALVRETRGIEYDGLDRSIDGRISKLRRKLGDNGDQPRRIKTVWGKGYLLVPDAWDE